MKILNLSLFALLAALAVAGSAMADDTTVINGAGATFPYPLYSKWFSEFHKVDGKTEINYQSIGSGGGIRQFTDKTIDFGATDAPMSDEEIGKVTQGVLHIPTVLGAVVVTYNLPEVKAPLKLSGDVVASIFMGKIKKWNDAAIVGLNKGVTLPATDITVAYRSDGSGTTAVFTDYLAKVSADWKSTVGAGKSIKWPVGLGGKGNEGVTGVIKQTPGSIGYVELVYAEQNKLSMVTLKNSAGQFIVASPKSVTAAAEGSLKEMPKDFRISITNSAGKAAYPISSFTYLLVAPKMDAKKGKAFLRFLNWAIADGQKMAEPLSYAPLPKAMVANVKATIAGIKAE